MSQKWLFFHNRVPHFLICREANVPINGNVPICDNCIRFFLFFNKLAETVRGEENYRSDEIIVWIWTNVSVDREENVWLMQQRDSIEEKISQLTEQLY